VNIALSNQSVLSGVILVLLWYSYGYIIVYLPFLANYFYSAYYFIFGILQVVLEHLPRQKNVGNFFFRVETYSDIFKLHRFVVMRINPWSGIHTRRKYKWYLSAHLLATLVTPVGTPSSGSASNITCIRIDLDLLNPSINKSIIHLTAIEPPRTTLRNTLSSTWVVG
jgi:hypothetical protein